MINMYYSVLRGKTSAQVNTGRVERFSIVNGQPKPEVNPSAQNLAGIEVTEKLSIKT